MTNNVAILAGEASGDAYGALLAHELRANRPDVHVWGLGGPRMQTAQVDLLADCRGWAAIGVVQALQVAPGLRFRVLPKLLKALSSRRPALVVPIDFGAFNVPVVRWCKRRGLRVLYYLPPGSWRRTGAPPTELARLCDGIATQFPWSKDRLENAGANVEFVGHPLLDLVAQSSLEQRALAATALDLSKPLVALLPGSRTGELLHNTEAMAEAALLVWKQRPNVQFAIALAAGAPRSVVEHGMRRLLSVRGDHGEPVAAVVEGVTHEVLRHSCAGLVCSGTATLEAAILGVPMVILYRGSRLMYVEYVLRRTARIQYVGLPNILADKQIVPELIAKEATPEALARELSRYLDDHGYADGVRRDLAAVQDALGEPGATRRTAEMALSLIDSGNRETGITKQL